MKQSPRALYEAHTAGERAPSWDRLSMQMQAAWLLVGLRAAGMTVERIDPAFEAIRRTMIETGAERDPVDARARWHLLAWGRMSASYPIGLGALAQHAGEASAGALAAAFADLAGLAAFELIQVAGPGESKGDLSIAAVELIQVSGAVMRYASRLAARSELEAQRARVAATFRRIAHCFDQLVGDRDGQPPAMVGAFRCAATWIETPYMRGVA